MKVNFLQAHIWCIKKKVPYLVYQKETKIFHAGVCPQCRAHGFIPGNKGFKTILFPVNSNTEHPGLVGLDESRY